MRPSRSSVGLIVAIGITGFAVSVVLTPTGSRIAAIEATASPTATRLPAAEDRTRPPAVTGFDLLPDPGHHRVMLVNGLLNGLVADPATVELWTWDGTRWEFAPRFSTQVPGRTLAAAALGPDSRMFIFGGWGGNHVLGDTWVLMDGRWSQLDVDGPSPRDHISAAYDEARGMMVFFSGVLEDGSLAQETWGFNGREWTLLSTEGPDGRAHYAIAYDQARQQVILFGGTDGQRSFNDLWAWDGTRWTEIETDGGPSPRDAMAMAYDPGTESILLFGGRTGQQNLDDFWRWNGARWEEINVERPEGRSFAEMAYDTDRGRMVMFGGYTGVGFNNPTNETWEWDGSQWEKVDG